MKAARMKERLTGEWLALKYAAAMWWERLIIFARVTWHMPGQWLYMRPFLLCVGCKQEWITSCIARRKNMQLCEKCRKLAEAEASAYKN